MDITSEKAYPTPYANSAILPLLLLSLSSQRIVPKVTKNIDTEYDYIIVGGGIAGSVVANRLSELPCVNVLLLEAGKDPPLLTEVPALSKFFKFTNIDWNYRTIPQKNTGEALVNKQIPLSSGKSLGGSSILNSMLTIRGNPLDYEEWASNGADGWSYEDVISYFKKLEDNKDIEYIKNGFHSSGGPQTIHRPRYQAEIKKPVFQAARSIGYKVVDPNGLKQTGFYDFQATLRNGQRCSVSKAYLVPAENRTNLHILSRAMVRKIVIKNGMAVGVLYDYEGHSLEVKARKEVILSAGPFNSPQLLMLSGIGPKNHLESFQIPVLADLPVGENLQDHCAVPLNFILNSSIPSILMKLVNPANIDQYIKTRNGVLSSADFITAVGFVNEMEGNGRENSPSYQIRISEDTTIFPKLQYGLKPEVYLQVFGKYERRAYITCFSGTLHPRSRGTVKLQSANIYDSPLIDPNYLEHPKDMKDIVEGLKTCMKLAKTPSMKKLSVLPFDTYYTACSEYQKKEELYFWCLAKQVVISLNSAVGTVKMGSIQDPTTVVDSKLRVKNIKGLRVVDSSVMPKIPSGDSSIPTMMIAERASDILKSTVDCDDQMAESDVQASVPMISISADFLESLPTVIDHPVQRRNDNAALEQLKEALGLSKRRNEDYRTRATDKHQDQIKQLRNIFQDSTVRRRQPDRHQPDRHQPDRHQPDRHQPDTPTSVSELIQCLEDIKLELQNKKRHGSSNSYHSKHIDNNSVMNQIISVLNSAAQNNNPNHGRNRVSSDRKNAALKNKLMSVIELLNEEDDISEPSSREFVVHNSQISDVDSINKILSVLNPPVKDDVQPHVQIDSGRRNDENNKNIFLTHMISALQNDDQENQASSQNQSSIGSTPTTNQSNIQEQLNQILVSINELKQGTTVTQNETDTINTTNSTSNSTDKTQEMMSQILSAIHEMKTTPQQSEQSANQTSAKTTNNEQSQETALNQILKALNEMKQTDNSSKSTQNDTSVHNSNKENLSDLVLTQIVSSINEMKEDIRAARNSNMQNTEESIQRQGIASIHDQTFDQRSIVQGVTQQASVQQSASGPLIETVVVQPQGNSPQQTNSVSSLLPNSNPSGVSGLPLGTQALNPVMNLLEAQRQLQTIATLLGRNPGINQPPVLPPPFMGIPPGGFPNRLPFPPHFIPPGAPPMLPHGAPPMLPHGATPIIPPGMSPFAPPGMPANPCHKTVVMNNVNLCNGSDPQKPLTAREAELCKSLFSGTQCQNGNGCRSIPPYLYNYYCNGK